MLSPKPTIIAESLERQMLFIMERLHLLFLLFVVVVEHARNFDFPSEGR